MHNSVRDYWGTFNQPLEGRVPFMYLDVKGLVSTGVGNLIDATQTPLSAPSGEERETSLRMAGELGWLSPDGSPASPEQVAAAWDAVKARMDLAPRGGGSFASITDIRITDDEIERFMLVKLDQFEAYLIGRQEFSAFEQWPADAQLGLLSMAWAMGPAFRFPKFQGFVVQGDFESAATECRFNPEVGTIIRRNDLDQECFRNAARVINEGLDPTVLLTVG